MTKKIDSKMLVNGFTQLTQALGFPQEFGVQLSQIATLQKNNRNHFVSNDRTTLTYAYTTHGIVQTLIDQPVDDAFRGGIIIKSNDLDAENIRELQNWLTKNKIIKVIKQLFKWNRLFGGGALVINTIGRSDKPLNVAAINENSFLEFYAADLWELNKTNAQIYSEEKPYVKPGIADEFFFYGNKLDRSRLIITKGKEAPSFAKQQLRGWGMSEFERLLRSFNQYAKNQNVIFELLDEAKIDVYRLDKFNNTLLTEGGSDAIIKRVQMANRLKNYQSAIVLDKDDEYEQKQLNFNGLSEMLQQIRIGIANDLRMPLTKIFGQGASGFNSGEDDIENYNAMIESEIRGEADNVIVQVLELGSQKLFGFVPELQIEYKPLRILSAEQEENVKTSKLNNIISLYDRGLMDADQMREEINAQNIFTTELITTGEEFPLPPPTKPRLDLSTFKESL